METKPCLPKPSVTPLWESDEVCAYLRISRKHLYSLLQAGLPCVRLGRSLRFDSEAVVAYLKKNPRLSLHRERQAIRAQVELRNEALSSPKTCNQLQVDAQVELGKEVRS